MLPLLIPRLLLPSHSIPYQLHIDQNHSEEAAPSKADEDFFADCDNELEDNNTALGSGAFLGSESGTAQLTKVSASSAHFNLISANEFCICVFTETERHFKLTSINLSLIPDNARGTDR